MIKRAGSVMKDPSRSMEHLAYFLKKDSKVLVPDGLDGWNALAFAFKGHRVTIYESEDIFIKGGNVVDHGKEYKIHGLRKRIDAYQLKNVEYEQKNFYDHLPTSKFDLVYANRTLNRECNSHLSIEEKVKSLQSVILEGGELYLYYLLAVDEDDYETYPLNQYPRYGQIPKLFGKDEWEVLLFKERFKVRPEKGHFGNPELHYHKIGYVHVRKKISNQIHQHKYRYRISLGKR